MLKNFLKNHPIHKNISVRLDPLFIFRPTIFFSVWLMICIGMYLPLFVIDSYPSFISGLSYKTISLFFGVSLLAALLSIHHQLSKTDNKYIIREKFSQDCIDKIKNILPLLSSLFLIYADYKTLIPGILILLIGLKMFKNSSYHNFIKLGSIICLCVLMIFIGIIFSINIANLKISALNIKLIMSISPYLLTFISIYIYMETYGNTDFKNNNLLNDYSKKVTSIIVLFLMLIALAVSLIMKDPLSSTSVVVSFTFFIYAFLRGEKKDFIRAFRYTLAIFNFFILTIYPLLFFPLILLFYISKYYYWHRFNIHYPTFLVDPHTYNPLESIVEKNK